MKHDHSECEHEVKFCKKCNVVYCLKCDKQWYEWHYSTYTNIDTQWPNPIKYGPDWTYYPYSPTWTSGRAVSKVDATSHNH